MMRFLKRLFTSTPPNGWWVCPHPHGYQLYRGSVPHEPFEATAREADVQAIADERNEQRGATVMEMPRGYDAWRLSGPDEHIEIGTEDGQPCLRTHEPDEDAPRGYRPTPCQGEMVEDDGVVMCDVCGEIA